MALAVGLLEVVGGVSLLAGCLTPLACALVCSGGAVAALADVGDLLPLRDGLFLVLAASVTAAVVLLGPGAFSLDARLFGRRKVIIPHASHTPEL